MFRHRLECLTHEEFVESALHTVYSAIRELDAKIDANYTIITRTLMTIEDDQKAAQADLDTAIAKVSDDFATLEARIAALDATNPDPAAVQALKDETAALRSSTQALQTIDTSANVVVSPIGDPNASANPADVVPPPPLVTAPDATNTDGSTPVA